MKAYMSLWTGGKRADSIDINSWKLALALAKRNYGFVYLVTDTKGAEILKDLPFTDVYVILDDIPKFQNVWILGKIFAYKYATQFGEPFVHLDSDFYIWLPFPEAFETYKVFAQCPDTSMKYEGSFAPQYNVDSLKNINYQIIPNDWEDVVYKQKINFHPINMGVFGGSDMDLIKDYCDSVLSLIDNPIYRKIWESKEVNDFMVEQFHLGIWSIKNNINIELLHGENDEGNYYQKFVHMHGLRTIEPFKSAIASRVNSDPYDLLPKAENEEVKKQTGIINFPV
jgi:hypothetical protein